MPAVTEPVRELSEAIRGVIALVVDTEATARAALPVPTLSDYNTERLQQELPGSVVRMKDKTAFVPVA